MKFKDFLALIRVHQWYKNLVVFLAIFFSGNFFDTNLIYLTIVAFFSLSFVSSAGYIINDLVDLKKDLLNPEKRTRPLASGKVKKPTAIFISLLLLAVSIYMAHTISIAVTYFIILLFISHQIYTFFLKNIIFADILSIATFFVIRAITGAFAIEVKVSPWLILCPFFLSLFLSIGKRQSELHLLKEKSAQARKVLKEYNKELTNSLMIISTTLLIISYALYSFLSEHANLLYTLPFALFVIFRFYYLIDKGSEIARHPERIVKDKAIIVGMILWAIVVGLLIYY
ncbi:decaprenyl-phosphate phosphoribosyltransferase [Candidatus Woesearchaeota archaeon]|jgi:4-hydroxybenzoate polyprenyltransferase|nr:decaprenyl-phosphate phosphoribosyltransferase [Candidatus Woesearchaeota archaeon]MBT4110590.1 decaprenyl-phosphate phosphoribosyltransferase [Candidatus Woesearchaeota archaeon]MBT4335886.1 decaprenyl-phosphate phosphoribosyltransferase [Candidatus Woesearchaeota archaeon]MBT4469135.1 decaprenyl-phosphate phosphoribosyltransferase [Candidatus Woesearchaeota archaeon]MBT6744546.1 decaprenyl-phosphate phosphoribosyltransferase [Candidatus Woesearchaeota archaeon]